MRSCPYSCHSMAYKTVAENDVHRSSVGPHRPADRRSSRPSAPDRPQSSGSSTPCCPPHTTDRSQTIHPTPHTPDRPLHTPYRSQTVHPTLRSVQSTDHSPNPTPLRDSPLTVQTFRSTLVRQPAAAPPSLLPTAISEVPYHSSHDDCTGSVGSDLRGLAPS